MARSTDARISTLFSGCTFETQEITIAVLEALGDAGIYNIAMVKEIREAFESEKKED